MSELIKHFESCRLTAYQDSADVWTIGWGSTKGIKKGMTITQEEADRKLDLDLYDAEMRVKKAIPDLFFTLASNEQEALISLAYNLRSFEALMKHLKKDEELFKKKMLLYCKDIEGNFLKGLKIRRIAERLLFEGRDWKHIALEMQRSSIDEINKQEKELFV